MIKKWFQRASEFRFILLRIWSQNSIRKMFLLMEGSLRTHPFISFWCICHKIGWKKEYSMET